MGTLRGCKVFLVVAGCMFLILPAIYYWTQGTKMVALHQRQEERKQLLGEMCRGEKRRLLEDMTDKELENLIVDDRHGIIYCYIPKVACTNLKRVMFILLNQTEPNQEPYQDPNSVSMDLMHIPKLFPLLNSFPRPELKARLKHYTKFLFVRDPFIRLISGYRDKFQRHNEYFYQNYARHILRLYGNQSDPPESVDEAFKAGIRPSFYQFIQYLLDPKTEKYEPLEPHWRQMHRLCHPCQIKYDFVGHQETIQEDAPQLLRILRLENEIKVPHSYDNTTSFSWLADRFSTVPLEARRKLYKLYEFDFKLFGYKKPETLLSE